MQVTQLEPALHVLTPIGEGDACFLMFDDFDVFWQVFIRETGESWWWDNHLIRLKPSLSGHHVNTSPIRLSPGEQDALQKFSRKQPGEK